MGSNLRSEPRHLSLPHSQEGLKITPILTPESELSSTQRQRRSQVPVQECCRSGGQTGLRVLTGMDRGGHPAPKYSMQSLPFSWFFFFILEAIFKDCHCWVLLGRLFVWGWLVCLFYSRFVTQFVLLNFGRLSWSPACLFSSVHRFPWPASLCSALFLGDQGLSASASCVALSYSPVGVALVRGANSLK